MGSLKKILLLAFIGLAVSNCSSSPEPLEDETPVEASEYQSSGVYGDIERETRSTSSEPYSDDNYGALDEEGSTDEALLADSSHESPSEEPAVESPRPKIAPTPRKPKKSQAIVGHHSEPAKKQFKSGMYGLGRDCDMHSKPTLQSKKVGSVSRGKKLWMEPHDGGWVKVFKKSGPVYLKKDCIN